MQYYNTEDNKATQLIGLNHYEPPTKLTTFSILTYNTGGSYENLCNENTKWKTLIKYSQPTVIAIQEHNTSNVDWKLAKKKYHIEGYSIIAYKEATLTDTQKNLPQSQKHKGRPSGGQILYLKNNTLRKYNVNIITNTAYLQIVELLPKNTHHKLDKYYNNPTKGSTPMV